MESTGGNNNVIGGNNNRLAADINVEDISEEELKFVLNEICDHNLRESEKCPLVQRLKQEDNQASTSKNCSNRSGNGSYVGSNNRSKPRNRLLSKDNEFRSSTNHNHQRPLSSLPSSKSSSSTSNHSHNYHHQTASSFSSLPSNQINSSSKQSISIESRSDTVTTAINNNYHSGDNLNSNVTSPSSSSSMSSMSSHFQSADDGCSGIVADGSCSGNLKPNRANSFFNNNSSSNFSSSLMPSSTNKPISDNNNNNNNKNFVVDQTDNLIISNNNNNYASSNNHHHHSSHYQSVIKDVDHNKEDSSCLTSKSNSFSSPNNNSSNSNSDSTFLENSSQSFGDSNKLIGDHSKYSINQTKRSPISPESLKSSSYNSKTGNDFQPSFSSVHLNSMNSLVNSIDNDGTSLSKRMLQSDNKMNSHQTSEQDDENREKMYVEMKNLAKRANIIEYNSDVMRNNLYNNKDSVDKIFEMPHLTSNRSTTDDQHYALASNNYSSNSTINNSTSISTSNRREKKKKNKEDVKLAQDIDGHIGYMDISYLESIINNTSSSNTNHNNAGNNSSSNSNKSNNAGNISANVPNNGNVDKKSGKEKHQNHIEAIHSQQTKNKNNSDNKKTNATDSSNVKSTMNKNKMNSASCDDISVNNKSSINEMMPNDNTSPELSSSTTSNNQKAKKNKSKRAKQNKNGSGAKVNRKNLTNSDGKLAELKTNEDNVSDVKRDSTSQSVSGKSSNKKNDSINQNSSSDDFEDATDAEDEEEEDMKMTDMIRSKKSNSLMPSSKEVEMNDVEHEFCTVSDSEMVDREIDFVTPKSKYLKRKKHLARNLNNNRDSNKNNFNSGFQSNGKNFIHNHHQANNNRMTSGNRHNSNATASTSVGVNHLGRGYESERECSVNNSITNASNCVSQSLSSSMLAIDVGKKSNNTLHNHSQQAQQQPPPPPPPNNDKFVEEFPPHYALHSANSDNHLNIYDDINSGSSNVAVNGGMKIPSYAEIAKSFNVTNTKQAQLATKLSHSSQMTENSAPINDEFPQLDSCNSSNIDTAISTAANTTLNDPLNNKFMNDENNSAETTIVTKTNVECDAICDEKPCSEVTEKATRIDHQSVDSKSLSNNIAATNNNDNSLIEEKRNSINVEMTNIENMIASTKNINGDDKNGSPAVLIYGDSVSFECQNINLPFKESAIMAVENPKKFSDKIHVPGEKIIFGFFDDIQTEFDKIQDNSIIEKIPQPPINNEQIENSDKTPSDKLSSNIKEINSSSSNNKNNYDDQNKESKSPQPCKNDVNFEMFKKNAVHVNDLENHWQEEASKMKTINNSNSNSHNSSNYNRQGVTNPNKKALSSCTSSPLSSSFDSSPMSSTTVSSSSIHSNQTQKTQQQQQQRIRLCFISCLKKYRNISLNDNAELSINNYSTLINYIYNNWVNKKCL